MAVSKLKSPSQFLNGTLTSRPSFTSEHGDHHPIVGARPGIVQDRFSDKSSDDDEFDEEHKDNSTLSTTAQNCPNCVNGQIKRVPAVVKPERWKTLLAFTYVLLVSWATAFVMGKFKSSQVSAWQSATISPGLCRS